MRRSRERIGPRHRLIGWLAAYALVLHAIFAGAVATQPAATAGSSGAAGFALCIGPDAPLSGHGQAQHEGCAIHCVTLAGGLPLLALALVALLFSPRASARPVPARVSGIVELRRAGRSRAPPLPA